MLDKNDNDKHIQYNYATDDKAGADSNVNDNNKADINAIDDNDYNDHNNGNDNDDSSEIIQPLTMTTRTDASEMSTVESAPTPKG